MPPRSNTRQRIIAMLRELLAVEGFTVTESKQLPDRRTGSLREVDVVMEGTLNDVALRICYEVFGQKRKATVDWVEKTLNKHAHLDTDKLYLVSRSGFSKDCAEVARAGGAELVTVDEHGPGPTLYVGTVDITPSRMVFTVAQPDGTNVPFTPQTDTPLYNHEHTLLGETRQLLETLLEMLRQPEIGRGFLELAYAHPERDQLTHFTVRLPSPNSELHLRNEPDGAMYRVMEIELVGEFRWKQQPLDMHLAEFLQTRFAFGQSTIARHDALAVTLVDALGNADDVILHFSQRRRTSKRRRTSSSSGPVYPGAFTNYR